MLASGDASLFIEKLTPLNTPILMALIVMRDAVSLPLWIPAKKPPKTKKLSEVAGLFEKHASPALLHPHAILLKTSGMLSVLVTRAR